MLCTIGGLGIGERGEAVLPVELRFGSPDQDVVTLSIDKKLHFLPHNPVSHEIHDHFEVVASHQQGGEPGLGRDAIVEAWSAAVLP